MHFWGKKSPFFRNIDFCMLIKPYFAVNNISLYFFEVGTAFTLYEYHLHGFLVDFYINWFRRTRPLLAASRRSPAPMQVCVRVSTLAPFPKNYRSVHCPMLMAPGNPNLVKFLTYDVGNACPRPVEIYPRLCPSVYALVWPALRRSRRFMNF